MPKLRDIVWRSALRSRAADLDVLSPQVFEVTDLLIPAGTDWSTVPHTIGEFTWPVGRAFILALSLEAASPPAAGDEILIEVDTPDVGSTMGGELRITSTSGLLLQNGAVYGAPPHPDDDTWEVHLFTNRVLTAPVTVSRARATIVFV